MDREQTRSEIERDILEYLTDHADAKDTLEGVAEWWLLQHAIRSRTADVANVLADLVARGILIEHKRAGTRTHYRVNEDRRADIARLVRRDDSRQRGSP
jgi:trehalose-6-phosphatase